LSKLLLPENGLKETEMDSLKYKKRTQFSRSERSTVAIIATNLLGWRTNVTRQAKNRIALAAYSLMSYDVGFKCVVGEDINGKLVKANRKCSE
jgi:high-affinity nickel permease